MAIRMKTHQLVSQPSNCKATNELVDTINWRAFADMFIALMCVWCGEFGNIDIAKSFESLSSIQVRYSDFNSFQNKRKM